MRRLIASALLFAPAALFAQGTRAVDPGMSRAQVVAVLGEPATARTVSEYSYLFYPNACGRACGMNDLVILRRDSVVDAIFRSPNRHYSGVSSSPSPVPPVPAAKKAATKAAAPGQIRVPREANDARPSIPAKPPALKPAPATSPAPAARSQQKTQPKTQNRKNEAT